MNFPMVFQLYVYDPVPPLAITVALPSLCPQLEVERDTVKVIADGWLIAVVVVALQPLLSVTVTL